MRTLLTSVGLLFLVSGFLSIAKFTNAGLDLISRTQIHTLPFLATYPAVWVYVVLGLILVAIAGAISRR